MTAHECDACRMQPGSDTARQAGCTCPVLDNGRGHITQRQIVVVGCPVHHPASE